MLGRMAFRARIRVALIAVSASVAVGCSRGEAETKAAPETVVTSEAKEAVEAPPRWEGREFPLLVWAGEMVAKEYYQRERFRPRAQLDSAMRALGAELPEFFGERKNEALEIRLDRREHRISLAGVNDMASAIDRLEELLIFTSRSLGMKKEEKRELEYAAINGFLAPLDPHTILLTPEETTDLGVRTKGRFGGIGVEVTLRERRLLVTRVMPDSPALAIGLKVGDVLLRIDGRSTLDMPPGSGAEPDSWKGRNDGGAADPPRGTVADPEPAAGGDPHPAG